MCDLSHGGVSWLGALGSVGEAANKPTSQARVGLDHLRVFRVFGSESLGRPQHALTCP